MKSLMVLGAIVGFLTGALFGLAARSEGAAIFWNASAAALAGSIMLRWWGVVWLKSWKKALEQRLAAEALHSQTDSPPPSAKS